MKTLSHIVTRLTGLLLATAAATALATEGGPSVVAALATATPNVVASTVPSNGDLNPYGVAFVPEGFPRDSALKPGDVLVANFNDTANVQGTGTTIVRVTPQGALSLFFQGPAGLGLTTALGVLRAGFVIVGNLPATADGSGTCGVETGSLLVLDRNGHLVRTLTSGSMLAGPWYLEVRDEGRRAQVFVSNVLDGSVTRLDLRIDAEDNRVNVQRETRIASGYAHGCDPAALVVGPTGLALDADDDVLYVASTGDNAIFAVHRALERNSDGGTGRRVIDDPAHLHGPLGLLRTTEGSLITTQGDAVNADPAQASEIVEYDSDGRFVAQFSIDPSPGSAFGLALESTPSGVRFAAVDDGQNTLDIWTLPIRLGDAAQRLRAQAVGATPSTTTLGTPQAVTTGGTYGTTTYTLTATVTAMAAGNVTFKDGTTALGAGPVTLVAGMATLAGVSLAAGTHSLTATYNGDNTYAASTSAPPYSLTVSGGSMGGGGGGYGGAFGLADLALLIGLAALATTGRRLRRLAHR